MQLPNDKRKWKLPLVALAACFFLGVTAYWYTDGFDFPSTPVPLPKAPPRVIPKVAVSADSQKDNTPKPATTANEQNQLAQSPPLGADAGTLRNFAAKQAALDEVKLDVAIAEQVAKLTELREGKAAPAPVVVSAPQAMATLPPLPPLQPPLTSSGTEPSSPADALPPVRRTSGLMAIQGVDGSLSAVFATANGKKTVRVGDSIMGSKVRAINLDGVTLTSGKTLTIGD